MDTCVSVAVETAKSLVAPIGRQFGYALFYRKNIQALKTEVQKLRDTRIALEGRRDAALRTGDVVEDKVTRWLGDAKTEEGNVNDQLKEWEVAGKRCFRGWIPDPKTRYVIGRKAKKTALAIQELHGEGNFDAISHADVPEGALARLSTFTANAPPVEGSVIGPTTKADDAFESRTSLLNLIVKCILDFNINVVGVHGSGGVGKTTLMKQLLIHIKAERLFDEVAMATVSENLDVKKIQGELADMLGLKFTSTESEHGRAFSLRRRLEKNKENKKVLIILDDLWKELDLEEVGIPRTKGLKLLLTSRSQDVLSRKMGSQRNFLVEGLKDDEPWNFFREMVGDIADDPKVKPIAEEVVENCSGLPILLKTLAPTLKNNNLSQWEDALEILKRSKDVYSSLELSYKNLEGEELKHLFLTCSLLGTGQILVEDVFRYMAGLGLFEGINTMKKARETMKELLSSLQASSLLLEDDDVNFVRIHDIVRQIAITVASRDRHVILASDTYRLEGLPKEKVKKSTVISLPHVDVPKLPEGLQCPELKMFLYFAKSDSSSKVPDSFFEGMRELQVLDLTLLSFYSLPTSIQFLENLGTLCVDYCTVEDVTVIGNLKRLQILSFRGSSISYLPKEIAELGELRTLDLGNCSKLEKIEPGVLKSLSRLEELFMENSFTGWENEGAKEHNNASLAELNSMPGLSTLDIHVPDAALLPELLPFQNLFKYRILVGDAWDWSSDHEESRTLKLKLDSRDALLREWVQATLPRTHDLHLDGLRGTKKSIHELSIEGFHELKYLHVKNSPLFQYVVRSSHWLPCKAFTMLESLSLENLAYLEKIFHGHLTPESFSKLKVIKVKNCGKLRNLFSHCLMKRFSELEHVEISECEMLREIVVDVRMENDVDEAMMDTKVEMPNLRRLILHGLPEMTRIGSKWSKSLHVSRMNSEITSEDELGTSMVISGGCQISFLKLEALELSQLPNLDEIWWSESAMERTNLRSILVKGCGKLLNVISSDSLPQLQNLESLTIESCKAVKEVFDLEELNLGANASVLPQLHKIELVDLPDLRCMWTQNPKEVALLRNLKSLKVEKCNSLKYLFSFSAAKALKHIINIQIVGCMMMEEIVMKEEEGEVTDALVFQSLFSMFLNALPNLTCFARGNHSLSFPELKELIIDECPKMKAFSAGDYAMPSSEWRDLLMEENATTTCLSFFDQKVLLPSLEQLGLKLMSSIEHIWHNENLVAEPSSFSRLTDVCVRECESLRVVFPSAFTERVQNNLKDVTIESCPSVEVMFEAATANVGKQKHEHSALILYKLEGLKLLILPKLKHVVDGNSPVVVCFPSLKEISVAGCDCLTHLLPNATARNLLKLESLDILACMNMEEVVTIGSMGELHDMTEPILFPCLKKLKIWGLQSLICFSTGSCEFDFPSLVDLTITSCDSFKTFISRPVSDESNSLNHRPVGDSSSATTVGTVLPSLFDEKVEFPSLEGIFLADMGNLWKLWDDEFPIGYSFAKLTQIFVIDCNNLTSIFQSKVIGRFQNLKKLLVHGCDSLEGILEEIFPLQAGTDDSAISVPQASLAFDKLQEVNVEKCGKLEYLFPTSVARGLVQLREIDISDCGVMKELIAKSEDGTPDGGAVQLLFPGLTDLRFNKLPNLKRLFPVNYSLEWSSLKRLYAYECSEVKIFASELQPSSNEDEDITDGLQALISIEQVIPNLEELALDHEDVSMIQDGNFPNEIFRNLKKLYLACFQEGSSIAFPSRFLLDRFPDLKIESLTLCRWSSEEIFPDEAPGPQGSVISYKDGCSDEGKYSKALKNVTTLSLLELYNLKCVLKEDSLAAEILQRIESLDIKSCHRLTTVIPAASDSFKNLTKLSVEKCDGLMYLMTPPAARGLPRLARMTISNCEIIGQVIVADNGSEVDDNEICFRQLEYLKLDNLQKLTSFCSAKCNIAFPLLDKVEVTECPNMKIFSEGAVSTPKLQRDETAFPFAWRDEAISIQP